MDRYPQEYDLEFSSPKRKKALVLTELITNFPSDAKASPVNTDFPDEHLFFIPSNDPWYDYLLVYLQTHNFGSHLSRYDHQCILHQAPSYLLIGDVLYQRRVNTILRRCLTINEAGRVLNYHHINTCGGHLLGISTAKNIIREGYFYLTLFHDYIHAIKRCEKFHLYAKNA
jgi:hypothetical protein